MEEEKPPSFKESLENTLEIVAESPTLRMLFRLGLYPVPGPLKDWVIERGEAIDRKRTEELLVYLYEKIKDLESRGVTEEHFERFFNSEKGFDLFRQTLEASQKTSSNDRREYYARIIRGSILDFEQGHYTPEQYLNLLASLSDLELKVLGRLYEIQKDQKLEGMGHEQLKVFNSHRDRVRQELEIEESDLDLIFVRLASVGLLERVSLPLWPRDEREPLVYRTSSMFERMMEFLEML